MTRGLGPRHDRPKTVRHRIYRKISLPGIAYGPRGFTCACGGRDFQPEQERVVPNGDKPMIRRSHRCKKCRKSYIFVASSFAYGGV